MKTIITILSLIVLTTFAGDAKLYDVRCPNCLKKNVRCAISVNVNGGRVAVEKGVQGHYQSASASFHCENCHFEFTAQIKPDKFVPDMNATEVANSIPNPGSITLPVATLGLTNSLMIANAITSEEGVLVGVVPMPDGSELAIYHRKAK